MIEILLLITLGFISATFFFIVAAASWYDIRLTRDKRRHAAHPQRKQFRRRPHITILLAASEDRIATQRSINSLIKNSYKKHNIIVSGAKRSDFKNILKNKTIRFTKNNSIIGSGRGELVIKMNGGMTLPSFALHRIAWHFNNHPDLTMLVLAHQPVFYPSHAHLFTIYRSFIAELFHKATSMLGHVHADPANIVVTHNKKMSPNSRLSFFYAEDVRATSQPTSKISMLLKSQHKLHRAIGAWNIFGALLFLAISYGLYLALWQRQPTLFTLTTLASTLYIATTIWWSNHLNLLHKAFYTAGLPLALLYFYLFLAGTLLEVLSNVTKAIIPISIRLFVRVKNVFRIVQRF